jgi:hypothetical protein
MFSIGVSDNAQPFCLVETATEFLVVRTAFGLADRKEASLDQPSPFYWRSGEAALCRHLAADAFDVALLKNGYRATRDRDGAMRHPWRWHSHLNKPLGTAIESVLHLPAKAAICDRQPFPGVGSRSSQVAPSLPICRSRLRVASVRSLSPSPPWARS